VVVRFSSGNSGSPPPVQMFMAWHAGSCSLVVKMHS